MTLVHHEHLGAYRYAAPDTKCRVIMIGEDNPQSADPKHALYPYPPGCAGHRLSDILGLGMGDHLALWRTNLCNPRWSVVAARERRDELLSPSAPWNVLFLLGRKVAGVFEEILGALPPFSEASKLGPAWKNIDQKWFLSWNHASSDKGPDPKLFAILVLPHPSGRNLVWNNRENWRLTRQLARSASMQRLYNDIPFGLPEDVK